ncbi:Membrane protease subunit, stomatin/prohibitin family, contains C-terminal Zn-ribbon domain [Eubacterium ruminantium]|nr:Membrane protease subunit, stomatin/prohibitin family, contains C-terminal Zn-ribbon domain [Eubacterium ruminantium]
MGIIKAFAGALGGTFADQWKDIITADYFDEHIAVTPGYLKSTNNGRGTNTKGSDGVISNGSKIYVPENTAAFIFSQSGIEDIITEPGGYEYQNGQDSVFNGDGAKKSIFGQIKDRVGYGGITPEYKQVAFVNLREIRDIKFGTKGAQVYNDIYYGADLEIFAYGSFSVQVTDAERFIRNFVPANVTYYSFDDQKVRSQILAEFLQSFTTALNSLSSEYRISQLPSQANKISQIVAGDSYNAGTWEERFGFKIVKVAIENIEFTDDSRELVKQFSANKMGLRAYEDVSEKASNIAAQQKIAQGIQDNGFGNAGGMALGMAMAQGIGPQAQPQPFMQRQNQESQQVSPPPIPQPSLYNVAINGQPAGPYDIETLKQMAMSGQITEKSLVWKKGMSGWCKISDVDELYEVFPQTPPPIPDEMPPIPPM